MNIRFNYAAVSDVGMVRKNNEDNVYMPNLPIREPKCSVYKNSGSITTDKAFFCVCDGMGGHSAGEVASYIAVSHVTQNYSKVIELINKKSEITRVLRDFISNTNEVIYDAAQKNPEFTSMGTTLTGIYFMNGCAHFVNIGDSRVYALSKTKLKQLSVDHTDAENTHALTRFLGMSSMYGQVVPDVAGKGENIGLSKRFLLCSDGLTDMVDNAMIEEILIKEETPEAAARKLVEEAKKNGGRDNITVLIIDAKPANKVSAFLTSKAFLVGLCVVLAAGASGIYYLNNKPKGGGSSLSDISQNIENAENLMEAKKVFDDYFAKIDLQINNYDAFIASINESDKTVKAANDELKKSVQSLKSNRDILKNEYDNLINKGAMSDEELFLAIQSLEKTPAYMDIEKKLAECENKKINVDYALLMFRKAREEAQKKNGSNGNASNNSSSRKGNSSTDGNSSGGGYSSSGTGSGYSGERSSGSNSGSSNSSNNTEKSNANSQDSNGDTGSYDKFPGIGE